MAGAKVLIMQHRRMAKFYEFSVLRASINQDSYGEDVEYDAVKFI